MTTPERKWAMFWAGWVATFAVAEYIALRGGHPHAPLSHHVRRYTRKVGSNEVAKYLVLGGASWLHRHLYEELERTN